MPTILSRWMEAFDDKIFFTLTSFQPVFKMIYVWLAKGNYLLVRTTVGFNEELFIFSFYHLKKFVLFVFQKIVHVFAISINESSIYTWKASATNSSFNYASLVKCLLAFCCVEHFCQYRHIDLVQGKFGVKFSPYGLKRHIGSLYFSLMRQKFDKNS